MKILLIPGYGVGIRNPFVNLDSEFFELAGFLGFREMIRLGEAMVFHWTDDFYPKKIEFISPLFHYQRLKADMVKAESDQIINSLIKVINRFRPECIICHSLGGYLLVNAIKSDKSIATIPKKVIFLSTYLSRNFDFESMSLPFEIDNYYCFWDQALLSLAAVSGFWPAGLIGFSDKKVKNIFYPLKDNLNLHTSMVISEKFATSLVY